MARWGWPARAHARPPAASPRLLRVLAFWPRLVWTLLDGKSAEIGFFLSFLLILHGFSFAFGPVKKGVTPPPPPPGPTRSLSGAHHR